MTRVGKCQRKACNQRFVDTSPRGHQKFCSENCRKRNYDETKGRATCGCGKALGPGSKSSGAKRCPECYAKHQREERDRRWDKIERWWNEGVSCAEIGARLGWGPTSSVGVDLHAMRKAGRNVPLRYEGSDPDIRERAVEMYAAGASSARVAGALGISQHTVLLVVHEAGIARDKSEAQLLRHERQAA